MALANDMVKLLEKALSSAAGVKSVTIDGTTTVFESREALLTELRYWQSKVARAGGKRPLFRSNNLNTF